MKAISFAFFGPDPRYSVGAMRNAALAKQLFPGWEVVFYTDNTVPASVISELSQLDNVRVLIHGTDFQSNALGYYWRFIAAADPRYEAIIFRDVDSRLLQRDVDAVNAWLATDKQFHIIRDHPYHTSPMMPGAWGLRPSEVSKMIPVFLDAYAMRNVPRAEAFFLQTYLYPVAKHDSVVHDPFFEQKDFPNPRQGGEFISQSFDENDVPNQDFINALNKPPKLVPWL